MESVTRVLQEMSAGTSSSRYIPHESGNSSLTTSITIRVTPEHYHLLSWGILWSGFLLAIIGASCQVKIENQWLASKRQDVEQGNSASSGDGEAVIISSADLTRSRFRRLLLAALITRAIMIPVQICSHPLWLQFIADTLPEMTFASAWTLLVSFFVQLVGVALGVLGTGTSTSPVIVIQTTSYIVYSVLILTYFKYQIAMVLVYALLCCIYSALFGTTVYFCPRLLTLLRSTLAMHSGLSFRLAACGVLCIFVFASRSIGFALRVVAPPKAVFWWWEYGCLELIPSVLFLMMMRPNVNRASNANNGDKGISNNSIRGRRSGEYAPLATTRSSGYGSSGRIET